MRDNELPDIDTVAAKLYINREGAVEEDVPYEDLPEEEKQAYRATVQIVYGAILSWRKG